MSRLRFDDRGGPALETGDELRDVDVGRTGGALRLTLTRTGYPRLTRGLTEAAGRGRLAARGVVARGHDRHPHLVLELLVDHGAEDDVRVGMCGLLDLPGGLVDLPQRQVAPTGDRQQDRLRALQRRLQQR